jgi:hypothetical protein
VKALETLIGSSGDAVVDICLGRRDISNSHLLCEWRNRNMPNVDSLETVQKMIEGESHSPKAEQLIAPYGGSKNL